MIEGVEKNALDHRTRDRAAQTWMTMNAGGLLTPVLSYEALRDTLGRSTIENYMDVVAAEFDIKEGQRDQTHSTSMDEVSQMGVIADMKAANQRAILALRHTTTEYVLAVQIYEAKVKERLMGVKEYAALVEREMLGVAKDEAALAVEKEALKLVKTEAEIFKEYLARAMVEADIAKAQVDVAKANVRAVEADIAAGEAEIRLVQAEIKQYMAEAEKATLQADVAMVLAEIMTKQLSQIKLDVGEAEIAAGFAHIQSKLDDMLALYDVRVMVENLKADAEKSMLEENQLLVAAEQAFELLKEREVDIDKEVMDYNQTATIAHLAQEKALRELSLNLKKALEAFRVYMQMQKDDKDTWAASLVNAAQRYVHKNMTRLSTSSERRTFTSDETISAG